MVATLPTPERIVLKPQPGPQETFLSTPADIALYGGAAGGGKSWALLFEPLRHVTNSAFGCTVFRRTYPMVTAQGGLWDESRRLYPLLGAEPNQSDHSWKFPTGARVKFSHLQHEANVLDYQGSQIPLIGYDELTHFSEYMFTYLLSRNRSTCGVRPYVRATCNPDAASWVARWVEWYIDPSTGLPIPERAGKLRWFIRDGETLRWADGPAELEKQYPGKPPKSFVFIPASLSDNPILEKADPGYRANLEAMSRVDRERLLRGNWLISNAQGEWPGEYFGRHLWFDTWPLPEDRAICTIGWDPSGGVDSSFGDYSSFSVLVRDHQGGLWADAVMGRWSMEEAIDVGLELAREWKPDGFAIEAIILQKLIAAQFRRRSKELGLHVPVYQIENRVKKEVRIRRLGPDLQSRTLRLKGGSSGARLLAEQMMVFPNGDHDDGPDSLEMARRLMIELWNGKQQQRGARR